MDLLKSVAVCLLLLASTNCHAADPVRIVQTFETQTGVRFGIWGELPSKPSPTLFVLSGRLEQTLGDAYFRQCGNMLSRHGYLLVSIDLPCHGKEHRSNEPAGLAGWRRRCERDEDFVGETNKRLAQVLDHLIAARHTDPARVAVCGTSRGGFLAIHFAAFDKRVNCVAAFAPVTDLTALREFHGADANELVKSLALIRRADKLAGKAVWIIIGDRDERVGTDHAIGLARQITTSSLAKKLDSRVDLHVISEPRGHTTPAGAADQAALWIRQQIERDAITKADGKDH